MPLETVFVLGSGFSSYAGLPLQNDFGEKIVVARSFSSDQPSRIVVDQLDKFVEEVFHVRTGAPMDSWPSWEDLFTFLDLSANSGHHLGLAGRPDRLRAMRRAVLSRIVRMLRQRYDHATKNRSVEARQRFDELDKFLKAIDLQASAFISLNWDTVLELRLTRFHPGVWFDYGPHVIRASFEQKNKPRVTPAEPISVPGVRIAKMHGATNWLYCDNCRRQFSFPPNHTGRVALQLMGSSDWRLLQHGGTLMPKSSKWKCHWCGAVLGTRIATFSYRKVLDSPIMLRTWFFAEDLLREAGNWVFVGYSLPEADYEFKYFLKRIELARRCPPRLVLVDKSCDTADRYRRFFGERLPEDRVCLSGLGDEAVDLLRRQRVFITGRSSPGRLRPRRPGQHLESPH